jgi:hypothetical protein
MHTTFQQQLRPLISSLSSLEKVIQIQEDRRESLTNHHQITSSQHTSSVQWTYDKIQSIVEDTFLQKYPQLNEMVTSVTVENLLIQQREYLLNEMNQQTYQLRRETEVNEREFLLSIKKKYEVKFHDMTGEVKEVKEKTLQNQSQIKELTTNVAKMISKKIDRADLVRFMEEYTNGIIMDPSAATSRSPQQQQQQQQQRNLSSRHSKGSNSSSSSIFQSSPAAVKNSINSKRRMNGGGGGSGGMRNLTLKSNYRGNRPRVVDDGEEDEGEGEEEEEENEDREHLRKVLNHFKIFQRDHQDLKERVAGCQQEVEHFREEIRQEVAVLKKRSLEQSPRGAVGWGGGGGGSVAAAGGGSRVISPSSAMYTDWRIALGELSLNLRREMSEKCGREEMRSAIGIELNLVEKKINV